MSRSELEKEYELKGLSGSGADGLVYRGVHRASGQAVAIKEFPGGCKPFSKVLQELSFLFSTRHPNLVECQNLVYGGYGKSYLIMEYAWGGSLRDLMLRLGQVDPEEALVAIEQLLQGLAHLHSKGITHCDLKPENVLCFPPTDSGPLGPLSDMRLKIADFGVSVWAHQEGEGQSRGTPIYMAPEQFYDKARPASDVYSVGVVLYELITGSFLFHGDPTQLFLQHSKAQPNLERIVDPRAQEFCRLVLQKNPNQRPENAESALRLLHKLAGNGGLAQASKKLEGVTADPVGPSTDRNLVRLLAPKGMGCFALRSGEFLLSHSQGTDLLCPRRSRLSPNRLAEPTLAVSQPRPDGGLYLATPTWVGHLSAEGQWTPLFRPLSTIRALDYCNQARLLFMADNQSVTLCTVFGDLVSRLPLANYFLSPTVAASRGVFCATSGPLRPSCLLFHSVGEEITHDTIPLLGPAVACTVHKRQPVVLTLIDSSHQSPALLGLNEAREWESLGELPAGLLGARFQGPLLVARYERHVLTCRYDGAEQVVHTTDGTPLDAAWNFSSKVLSVLQQSDLSIEVVIKDQTPEGKRAA